MSDLKPKAFLTALILCLSCLCAGGVSAQTPPPGVHPAPNPHDPPNEQKLPKTCNPDFYDVLKARSWLEGRREMEVAETLILKPDSVLEYSCFNVRVEQLAKAADNMFSDNVTSTVMFKQPPYTFKPRGEFQPEISEDRVTAIVLDPIQNPVRFGPHPPRGISNKTLDKMLEDVILASFSEFVGRNFGHIFAGGTFAGTPSSGECSAMNMVWSFLKCKDINKNNFFRFRELLLVDPRVHPTPCNQSDRGTLWGTNIAAANPIPNGLGGVESMEPHLHKELFDVSESCSSAQPIQTGILVYPFPSAGQTPHPDAVCSIPGCTYDGAGACN